MEVEVDNNEDNQHKTSCVFCEGVVTLFKILTGLLEKMKDHLPPVRFNTALFKLRKCEYNINFFKVQYR